METSTSGFLAIDGPDERSWVAGGIPVVSWMRRDFIERLKGIPCENWVRHCM